MNLFSELLFLFLFFSLISTFHFSFRIRSIGILPFVDKNARSNSFLRNDNQIYQVHSIPHYSIVLLQISLLLLNKKIYMYILIYRMPHLTRTPEILSEHLISLQSNVFWKSYVQLMLRNTIKQCSILQKNEK